MAHTADNYTCHTRHVQRGNASEATQVPWPEATQVDRRNYPPGVDFFHTGVRRRKYKFAQTKHSGYRGPFSFDRVYASSSSLQCERNPPQGGNYQSAFAYVLCLCPLPMSFAHARAPWRKRTKNTDNTLECLGRVPKTRIAPAADASRQLRLFGTTHSVLGADTAEGLAA
jgi:hypothetical protein